MSPNTQNLSYILYKRTKTDWFYSGSYYSPLRLASQIFLFLVSYNLNDESFLIVLLIKQRLHGIEFRLSYYHKNSRRNLFPRRHPCVFCNSHERISIFIWLNSFIIRIKMRAVFTHFFFHDWPPKGIAK